MIVKIAAVLLDGATIFVPWTVTPEGRVRPSHVGCTDPVGAAAYGRLIASGEVVADRHDFDVALERHCDLDCHELHSFVPLVGDQLVTVATQIVAGRQRLN